MPNLPYYSIEKEVFSHWYKVLDLANDDYKLALKIKKFLIKNPDLITNPYAVRIK